MIQYNIPRSSNAFKQFGSEMKNWKEIQEVQRQHKKLVRNEVLEIIGTDVPGSPRDQYNVIEIHSFIISDEYNTQLGNLTYL